MHTRMSRFLQLAKQATKENRLPVNMTYAGLRQAVRALAHNGTSAFLAGEPDDRMPEVLDDLMKDYFLGTSQTMEPRIEGIVLLGPNRKKLLVALQKCGVDMQYVGQHPGIVNASWYRMHPVHRHGQRILDMAKASIKPKTETIVSGARPGPRFL